MWLTFNSVHVFSLSLGKNCDMHTSTSILSLSTNCIFSWMSLLKPQLFFILASNLLFPVTIPFTLRCFCLFFHPFISLVMSLHRVLQRFLCFIQFCFASFRFPYSWVLRPWGLIWAAIALWMTSSTKNSGRTLKDSPELWPSPTSTLSADMKSTLTLFWNSCLHDLQVALLDAEVDLYFSKEPSLKPAKLIYHCLSGDLISTLQGLYHILTG